MTAQPDPMPAVPARLPYVDLLKVCLAIMVIGIHAPLFADMLPGGWTLLNQGIYRIAVPTFFCLSAYVLSPALGTGGWRKWSGRILLLYVIWMTIYLPFWGKAALEADNPALSLLHSVAFGYWHLWYLIALAIGIPLLALLHKVPSSGLGAIAMSLSLVGVGLEYGTEFIHSAQEHNLDLWRNALFSALPYLILGHLLRRHDLPRFLGPGRAGLLLALGLALLIAEVLVTRFALGLLNPDDLRLSLMIAVPALACLALSLPTGPRALALIPRQTGSFANGLYFLHIGVLQIVVRLLPESGTARTLVIIALTAALTLICLRNPRLRRLF